MKQGRPRKEGPRKPCGQLRDQPNQSGATDERHDRIQFYTGGSKRGDAESPIGVLVSHGLVEQDVREKIATPYMVAMKRCFGSYGPAVPGDGTQRGHDGSLDDATERQARRFIKRCDQVLNRLHLEICRKIFHDFVVREEWPSWMSYERGGRLTLDINYNMELKLIVRILALLAEEFQISKPRAHGEMVVVRNFQQAEA